MSTAELQHIIGGIAVAITTIPLAVIVWAWKSKGAETK